MTELDLFYQYAPDIAEMILHLQDKTPEQWQEWKKACLKYASSSNPFVYGFIRKTLTAIDDYLEEESVKDMKIDDIRIFPCFFTHMPRLEKLAQKEQYYQETGNFESDIVLNKAGYLIDGFTTYLLAIMHDMKSVPVRYGSRQIIKAAHKPGGKLYCWEVPPHLINRIKAGDHVLVQTTSAPRMVIAAKIQEYGRQEPEPYRMVMKVLSPKSSDTMD